MRGINEDNLRMQCYKKQKSLWELLEDERRAKILINKNWQTCRRHLQQNEKSTSKVTPGRMSMLKCQKAAKCHHITGVEAKTQMSTTGKGKQ
jgi:hypothetical protein